MLIFATAAVTFAIPYDKRYTLAEGLELPTFADVGELQRPP